MTEKQAEQWYARASKEAIAYVRATAAGFLAQRGSTMDPQVYADTARDAFVMACALAAKFWPDGPANPLER